MLWLPGDARTQVLLFYLFDESPDRRMLASHPFSDSRWMRICTDDKCDCVKRTHCCLCSTTGSCPQQKRAQEKLLHCGFFRCSDTVSVLYRHGLLRGACKWIHAALSKACEVQHSSPATLAYTRCAVITMRCHRLQVVAEVIRSYEAWEVCAQLRHGDALRWFMQRALMMVHGELYHSTVRFSCSLCDAELDEGGGGCGCQWPRELPVANMTMLRAVEFSPGDMLLALRLGESRRRYCERLADIAPENRTLTCGGYTMSLCTPASDPEAPVLDFETTLVRIAWSHVLGSCLIQIR